jgi:hypothetical protein
MTSDLLDEYRTLNIIIEQDRAVTSFKYALLRATVDITQQYSHMSESDNDRVWYPLGLLIERWILYYYPICASEQFIPQLNGEKGHEESSKKVMFRPPLTKIIQYYQDYGGLSAFYNDYQQGSLPEHLQPIMRDLIRKIRLAITDGPIQHLGYSHHQTHFSVFDWDRKRLSLPNSQVNPEYLVNNCGKFSLPQNFACLFQYFGSFIIGEGTILSKWAEFTVNIARSQGLLISREMMLDILSQTADTQRQVQEAQRFYHQMLADEQGIACVWSGSMITAHTNLHIDHVLPFSLWKNNDLWNLMPATDAINLKKKDGIPSPDLLNNRHDQICRYWDRLSVSYPELFKGQIKASLLGTGMISDWMNSAFSNLMSKSRYLIDVRGYPSWNL